jgi:hypothetical protein
MVVLRFLLFSTVFILFDREKNEARKAPGVWFKGSSLLETTASGNSSGTRQTRLSQRFLVRDCGIPAARLCP